ncbi:M81 family metallopeptidase [Amycolatopsis jiangsuensis]|uniref:Microcystin degradation protein MlrC n=1 Tax=Amycolatopsis jiangsuensis TaxID=1181879 RepID=A0A840IVJ5_9PSEU|nr:M81 family metallopeptidase [Amycolatopsis jiangsuensis]MBB4686761.1 microcystin degradation protein MlrC [Amycolatopsis jiangsuensis]
MKILAAGFQHETNTFAAAPAGYANFENGEGFPALRRGDDVLGLAKVNLPIGGFLSALHDVTVQPVIWAAASPSGPVTADAYERITGEILQAAREGAPDGIYLDLHGAMVTEHHDDGEGELLSRLRAIVGRHVPIVASLDLHANLSERMFAAADALIAYRTYPHVDMAETGRRAARLLARRMAGEQLKPEWQRVPFLIPINAGCTDLEPAGSVYGALPEGLSFAAGFPAADIPDCGPVVFGYGTAGVREQVDRVHEQVTSLESDWAVALPGPEEAIADAIRLSVEGPVVIADTQDNPGAGGTARTTGLLKALLAADCGPAAIGLFTDPAAAAAAHAAGVGATLTLDLGGEPAVPGDTPVRGRFVVEHLSDGRCRFDGPMMHGNVVDLGASACLRSGAVRIGVTSGRTQMFDRNLFRMVGIEPERQRIVVVKSSVHFRGDFAPMAAHVLVAKSPGVMAADPADLPWRRLSPEVRISPAR